MIVTISGHGMAAELSSPATPASVPDTLSPAATGAVSSPPHAAEPSIPPAAPSPGPAALQEQKKPDRVLSQGEVDLALSKNREEEQESEVDPSKGFFVGLPSDTEKRDGELYAGMTGRIDKFLRYFQTRGRSRFELYLTRSGKYAEMMRGILERYGLPGDLIYLALIESGFSTRAYSVARAAGPWQFIASTGRRYGLRIDWWTDERRDFEKSTHAAAAYLKDLHGMFESWSLAAAAYNAGEGKIQKAVTRYKSEDYTELIRHRYLKQETKDYVPKMIAALTIAKEPDKYGFGNVKYEDPLVFDTVLVPGGTSLVAFGKLVGIPYSTLREWNPELRRFCTPPNREAYVLRLPKGYGAIASERMEEIRADAKVTFLLHPVKKGESLESLASRYNTQVSLLREMNGLKRNRIGRLPKLIIPVTGLSPEEAVPGREVSPRQVEKAVARLDDAGRRGPTVRVRKGETLSGIAKRVGVPVTELARANGLKTKDRIRAGRRLRVPDSYSSDAEENIAGAKSGKKPVRHVVRRGDTVAKIARTYGVTAEQLLERNNIEEGQALPRGRVLVIPAES